VDAFPKELSISFPFSILVIRVPLLYPGIFTIPAAFWLVDLFSHPNAPSLADP